MDRFLQSTPYDRKEYSLPLSFSIRGHLDYRTIVVLLVVFIEEALSHYSRRHVASSHYSYCLLIVIGLHGIEPLYTWIH